MGDNDLLGAPVIDMRRDVTVVLIVVTLAITIIIIVESKRIIFIHEVLFKFKLSIRLVPLIAV